MGKRKKGKSNFKSKNKITSKKQQQKVAGIQQFFGTLCERFSSVYINAGMDPENEDVLKKFDEINVQWKERARLYITANINLYPKTPQRQKFLATFERFVEALIKKYEDVPVDNELKYSEGTGEEMVEVPGNTLTDMGEEIPPEEGGVEPYEECIACNKELPISKLRQEDNGEFICSTCWAILEEDMKSDEEKDMEPDEEADVNDWYDCSIEMILEALKHVGVKTRCRTIKSLTPIVNSLDADDLSVFIRRLGI